jgi:hypothetical protein
MRFEVRDEGGSLLGDIEVGDITLFRNPVIRFAMMMNPRFAGYGFQEPSNGRLTDITFHTIDLKVSEWAVRPTIGRHGGYFPGRIDFCLIYEGPIQHLRQVRAFKEGVMKSCPQCGKKNCKAPGHANGDRS